MIGVALIVLTLAGIAVITQARHIERLTAQRDNEVILRVRAEQIADDALEDLAAETLAHAATKARVASFEADLIDAGREAATHANHLTAVMEAMAEGKPLSLVKGGRS